jgi:hypothetical protein
LTCCLALPEPCLVSVAVPETTSPCEELDTACEELDCATLELDTATLELDFADELDATLLLDFASLDDDAGVTVPDAPGSGSVAPAYSLIESRRAYAFACVLTSVRLME